ncbi:uncharacterized protein TrAtP1_002808 [Trichoderma atroviride]|uniref:Uncharacterized protein n=1 Tax=Hypocrea atroviridis (strain ATCC 20476 / IMI 206040) TaxID=452589 RepID=G9NX40_HYPAI|nr:uncharacterized protein TRIATDRAFT_318307 [Trichoderma atroviride IMI 206040]EHK44692.1 hypothetical protein TRIATDRAFT_318307 [Trichoderma atroviride IMI 206040]UKZ61547.1 hypothetical protein TrAtP1_002808 [Trichoderma atroviride]
MTADNAERPGQRGDDYSCDLGHAVQTNTTADFFAAIALGQESLVRNFIEQYPKISDAPNEHGETPLIAAVRADKPVIVRDLLWDGAKVNAFANYFQQGQSSPDSRTALQVAAAEGKLHMIRILRENRADVFLNAPDDVNALQLAAGNGHQSVVEHIQKAYAGAIGRPRVAPGGSTPDDRANTPDIPPVDRQEPVKHVSAQCFQTRKEKNLDCITWAIPKFILDKTPPTVISAITNVIVDKPKETRLLRKNVKSWCQEQIRDFPARVQKGRDLVDRGAKEALGLVTKTPEGTLQLMKRAPNALWTIMLYIGTMLRKLGIVAPYLLEQMTAIVQAIAKAIASIRAATLYSIKTVLSTIHSVFIEIPKRLVALVAQLKQTSCAMLQTRMGSLNKVIMIFAALALGICIIFSKRAWGLLRAPGKLAKKGVQEMMGLRVQK